MEFAEYTAIRRLMTPDRSPRLRSLFVPDAREHERCARSPHASDGLAWPPGGPPVPNARTDLLERIARLTEAMGAEPVHRAARRSIERLGRGELHVALVGDFKRGKTTLMNALLGQKLLPAGVVAATGVRTLVRHGSEPRAFVRPVGSEPHELPLVEVARQVSQPSTAEPGQGVAEVTIELPAPILAGGLCLVDTPGFGSVHVAADAVAREAFDDADAAILVIGADPPISARELELAAHLASELSELIVVLNKADRVTATDCEAACRFAARAIAERGVRVGTRVIAVSATDRLHGVGPSRDWDVLLASLRALASPDRRAAVLTAFAGREGRRLAGLAHEWLHAQAEAAYRPVVAAEEELLADRAAAARRAHEMLALHQRLARELARARAALNEQRRVFLADAGPSAAYEARRAVEWATSCRGNALRPVAAAAGPCAGARRVALFAEQAAARAMEIEVQLRAVVEAPLFAHDATDFLERSDVPGRDAGASEGRATDDPTPSASTDSDAIVALARDAARKGVRRDEPAELPKRAALAARARITAARLWDALTPERRVRRRLARSAAHDAHAALERGTAIVARTLIERLEDVASAVEAAPRGRANAFIARHDAAIAAAACARSERVVAARAILDRLAAWRHALRQLEREIPDCGDGGGPPRLTPGAKPG